MAVFGNSLGLAILGGTVTRATFAGPPILAFGEDLLELDGRWTRAVTFAAGFLAPLIGVESSADFPAVQAALLDMRRYWSSSGNEPAPMVKNDGTIERPCFMGPLLHLPKGTGEDGIVDDAWLWAHDVARTTAYHRYGHAMFAVSSIDPRISPPIYKLPANPTAADFAELAKVWRQPPAPTAANYTALAALEVARPGASKYYLPTLLDWVYTAAP